MYKYYKSEMEKHEVECERSLGQIECKLGMSLVGVHREES